MEADAFDLVKTPFFQNGITAPGPVHCDVGLHQVAAFLFEPADNVFHRLDLVNGADQGSVPGLDHNGVVHSGNRQFSSLGKKQAVVAILGQDVSLAHASMIVLLPQAVDSLPAAQVVPTEIRGDHSLFGHFLHDPVIHGLAGQAGVKLGQGLFLPGQPPIPEFGLQILEGMEKGGQGKNKHPAVPEVPAGFQKAAGGRQVRFFYKPLHLVAALPQVLASGDVSISGLRCAGSDPEGHEPFLGSQFTGFGHTILPHGQIVDEVIGREDGHKRLGVQFLDAVQTQDDGRQCVAPQGFADDLVLNSGIHVLDLFADFKDMLFIGHNPDPLGGQDIHYPGDCLLQEGLVPI